MYMINRVYFTFTTILLLLATPLWAIDTGVEGLSVDGRIKQAYSALLDLDGQDIQAGQALSLAEVKVAYRPNRRLTFIGNFWVRGDLNNPDYFENEGGLKSLIAGPPFPSGSFKHGTNKCNLAAREFCSRYGLKGYQTNFNEEIIREFSVKYRDRKNRFTFKAGKFQRGWGQSDGLRLLDILHSQDLRYRFVFADADEIRLPSWMVAMDFNLNKLGLAAPFEAIGMHRPTLEFNIAEVRHSKLIINNPTPSDPSSGGVFGFPWPDFVDVGLPHQSGLGAVAFAANLIDKDNDGFSRPELSLRLKFETLGGTMTLNGFYGTQDLPIVNMLGATVFVGSGVNDVGGSLVAVPVDHATLLAALWLPDFLNPASPVSTTGNPSGYMPYLRGAAGTGPLTTSPLTLLTGGACNDPVNDPGGAGLECSVSVDMLLDYTQRQKVIGFSFGRDLSDVMSFGPKSTSPALRMEFSYEFDKPFNQSTVSNPFVPGQLEQGAVANFVSPAVSIVKRDVTSIMIGFDYPLWIPGWDSQEKSIFTSVQWFNIHTKNADNLMAQAPYGNTLVQSNQNYMTFLWSAPLHRQRLVLEGLFIRNIDFHGTAYRQRIDFNYFGPHWRPRLEYQYFSGRKETAPIGFFNDKDFIEASITYQF